jgi:hypothetical protein
VTLKKERMGASSHVVSPTLSHKEHLLLDYLHKTVRPGGYGFPPRAPEIDKLLAVCCTLCSDPTYREKTLLSGGDGGRIV